MNKSPFIRDEMDKQESLSQGSEGGVLTDQHPLLVFVSQFTFLSQMKILDFFCFHFWLVHSFLMVSHLLPSTGFPCARQQCRTVCNSCQGCVLLPLGRRAVDRALCSFLP